MYLDYAATTPLSLKVKEYIIEILDIYYNPSSIYQKGLDAKKIISNARNNVAAFINGNPQNIIFTSSGSAANTLAIKGLTSENPLKNEYIVFYSPTAHKSILKASKSCRYSLPLKVDSVGKIDLDYLDYILMEHRELKPLVCVEMGNSEIGTINDIQNICKIVHKYNGIIVADATGYIPYYKVDMQLFNGIDFLTFSGHKLNALKGVGVLYNSRNIDIEPLVYGSQENGKFAGTENIIGIASLGKAVEVYDYFFVTPYIRGYVYNYIIKNIPDSRLVGASFNNRLPHNLNMCFKGIKGEALMLLLDMNGFQVSNGSACSAGSPLPSETLLAIGMDEPDIHSCIRMSFSGKETQQELDNFCNSLDMCVKHLRKCF
ncbi:aminotransferase class V-fold PLP-dependent enzyme [Lachnospiraceae bacterium NSJ-143]|nr:aminotransferase class V-fold PLP-dependent enzyme [Lachnospiraceae bacterium NSJ-143]